MVKRIPALLMAYARLDLLWLMKDSRNFFLYTVTDIIINAASITGVWLIAVRFNGIGGMGTNQILFMLGYSVMVTGVINTLFSFNVSAISRIIGRGQLDHVLIMPQPVWLTLLTEGFVPVSGSGVLLTGIGVTVYALSKIGYLTDMLFIGALAICVLLSVMVSMSFSFLWGSLAFYSPVGAEEICTSVYDLFSSLRSFPLGGVGMVGKAIMLSVLPVGLYAWFPSAALLGINRHVSLVALAVIALGYLGVIVLVFRKGLKHYVKSGTHRYSDRGHRR